MNARDVAEARQEYAVSVKRADSVHALCQGRPGYDPSLGVICYCGETIGSIHPDDWETEPSPLPPSQTTQAALAATPLEVQPEERHVTSETGVASAVNPADPILARIDVIDPTQLYTPEMVEEHLLDAVARLERGAHYERVCAEDVYDKTLRYEMALRRALLKAREGVGGGDANERKAWAELEVETEYVELMIAKMKLDAIKGTMHSLRSVISAYQTISRSVSTSYGAAGRSVPERAFNPKF